MIAMELAAVGASPRPSPHRALSFSSAPSTSAKLVRKPLWAILRSVVARLPGVCVRSLLTMWFPVLWRFQERHFPTPRSHAPFDAWRSFP